MQLLGLRPREQVLRRNWRRFHQSGGRADENSSEDTGTCCGAVVGGEAPPLSLTAPYPPRAGTMLAAGAAASFAFSGSDIVAKFNAWKQEHSKVWGIPTNKPSPAPAPVR